MIAEINLTPTASSLEIPRPRRASPNGGELLASIPISARSWGTSHECLAAVVLVHGLGAHSGWFEAFGRRLRLKRIFALSYDQVGFGKRRSEGFISYKQWLDDLASVVAHLKEKVGDKPLYIIGNSMGAAVAIKAVSSGWVQPDGLAIFSPGFDGHPSTFNLFYRAKALWQAFMNPDSEINLPYSIDTVTRDRTVVQWINNDPERRFLLPARMLLELLKMTFNEAQQCRKVSVPVLMLTAGQDRIIDNVACERFFREIGGPKQKRNFSEAWHDLMFDPVIDEVIDELMRFVGETSKIPREKLFLA